MSNLSIRSVEISNFRPYRQASVDLTGTEGHIHIIEGDQGAGKTSFHRAIQWGLYGGRGPKYNYDTNWNESARKEDDRDMSVRIKLTEAGETHVLHRDIRRFDHGSQRAVEQLQIATGEDTISGEEAQEFIHSRIPEDLNDFFFLDGEEIRDLIKEQRGVEIREEIEKVLKHTAILHAREDLDSLLNDRYRSQYKELEEENEERAELREVIEEFTEEKKRLREERNKLREEQDELKQELEVARGMLEDRDEEVMRDIKQLEAEIAELSGERLDLYRDLQSAWKRLPLGILSEEINSLIKELAEEEQKCEERLKEAQRSGLIRSLVKEAEEGICPICGGESHEPDDLPHSVADDDTSESKAEIEARKVRCREHRQSLERPEPFDNETETPGVIENRLSNKRDRITSKEKRKDKLLDEYGGEVTDSEKGELESSIQDLGDAIEELEMQIEQKEQDINDKDRDIKNKRKQKRKKAGNKELKSCEMKMDTAEAAKSTLQEVRDAHIRRKRDEIQAEMNQVFDMVSQSEFINARYGGMDFRGDPDDEDRFVIELLRSNGDRKRMSDHPPSAGETQITALSFIFGLNKFARYSTTIVFDTVAGRLDKTNSRAQGEFFATLDEDIILLVTDSELDELINGLRDSIGRHYEVHLGEDGSSVIEEVSA